MYRHIELICTAAFRSRFLCLRLDLPRARLSRYRTFNIALSQITDLRTYLLAGHSPLSGPVRHPPHSTELGRFWSQSKCFRMGTARMCTSLKLYGSCNSPPVGRPAMTSPFGVASFPPVSPTVPVYFILYSSGPRKISVCSILSTRKYFVCIASSGRSTAETRVSRR